MQQLLKYMILFKMHFGIFFYLKHKPKVVASFIATNIIASLIATKGPSNQSYGFPSSHVRMWELDRKEGWVPRTDASELCCWRRLLKVPWTARRSNKSILKEIKPWIFIGRTGAEAEAPIFWPPDAKNWLTGKHPDAGKDRAKGEEAGRGWDGGMASQTQWTWAWANSGRQWRTGRPSVLQFMGSQRVG